MPGEGRRRGTVTRQATHVRSSPTVAALVAKVSEALTKVAGLAHELTALVGEYRELTPLAT